MAEKKLQTKDMIIAVICTLLAVLSIVFYFLPAFTVEHSPSLNFEVSEKLSYSVWEMTKSIFTAKDWGSKLFPLLCIKDVYGMAVIIAGIILPIGILFIIATAVFAYLSWFKGEKFKKFCFLFSLCGMIFTTITLIATWYIAIQLKTNAGGRLDYFSYNIKGSMAYASFISLIIAFVVAIVSCAYYYFLDNFDDEEDEEDDEDDEDDDDEEQEEPVKVAQKNIVTKEASKNPIPRTTKATSTATKTTTTSTKTASTKTTAKPTTKSTAKAKTTK